jgi:hypothetical protein
VTVVGAKVTIDCCRRSEGVSQGIFPVRRLLAHLNGKGRHRLQFAVDDIVDVTLEMLLDISALLNRANTRLLKL